MSAPHSHPSRPAVRRHHSAVRLTHWLNAILLLGMIGSGLQVYGAYTHFGPRGDPFPLPNPWDGQGFPEWARLGGWLAGGLNWHFALAWPFVLTGLIYAAFLLGSGEWRSLLFRPRDLRPAWEMQLFYLGFRRDHPPQGKHNALQKAAYTSIVALGALATLSKFAIYQPVQLRVHVPHRCLRVGGRSPARAEAPGVQPGERLGGGAHPLADPAGEAIDEVPVPDDLQPRAPRRVLRESGLSLVRRTVAERRSEERTVVWI